MFVDATVIVAGFIVWSHSHARPQTRVSLHQTPISNIVIYSASAIIHMAIIMCGKRLDVDRQLRLPGKVLVNSRIYPACHGVRIIDSVHLAAPWRWIPVLRPNARLPLTYARRPLVRAYFDDALGIPFDVPCLPAGMSDEHERDRNCWTSFRQRGCCSTV
jgi:hypothetical protein